MSKIIQIAFIIICSGVIWFICNVIFQPRLAYIDTAKILVGFADAAKVDKDLTAEDEKNKAELKLLQDTLATKIEVMSKEYNTANAARKKELQDELAASNQQINNFRQASMNKLEKMRQEKMQAVISKVNLYMAEYGKKHRYSIIFGTANGSIMYGNTAKYDISDKIIKGLNERYK
jgi:outer membrane protein